MAARSSETSEQTNGPTRSKNAEGYRMTFRNFHGDVISCFLNVQYENNRIQRHAMRHLQWSSLATITFFKGLCLKQKRQEPTRKFCVYTTAHIQSHLRPLPTCVNHCYIGGCYCSGGLLFLGPSWLSGCWRICR